MNEQARVLGNAGKYTEAWQLISTVRENSLHFRRASHQRGCVYLQWQQDGKPTDHYTVGIMRDLTVKEYNEKRAADPRHQEKLLEADSEALIKGAKLSPSLFTTMAKCARKHLKIALDDT